MKKEVICIVCPRGCHITADVENETITNMEGYGCKRGQEYGTAEILHPVRILTTTVLTDDGTLVPVRSEKPLPKEKIFDCMAVIRETIASLPVRRYDVIVPDICGTGVNIVATGERI